MQWINLSDIEDNIAIMKINNTYHDGISDLELYDATRGIWKIKLESVKDVDYVLSVAFGMVKEVYKVDAWVPDNQLNRKTIPYDEVKGKDRIGFFGKVAEETIRKKYLNKSVAKLYKRGEANSVKIICDKLVH